MALISPDEQVLVPGVIDTATNFVEHPLLIAQRICCYADLVGRERVIAGIDCGFATFAGPHNAVVPSVAWAKLAALGEGARLASDRLWKEKITDCSKGRTLEIGVIIPNVGSKPLPENIVATARRLFYVGVGMKPVFPRKS